MSLNKEQQRQLLELARNSIEHGLQTGKALMINLADYPTALKEQKATFVTLHRNAQLRGCIGVLKAIRPLVEDIVENAFSAAFKDSRFPPLASHEFNDLDIHLLLLTPTEPIAFSSEQDLLAKLKPGIDGLVIQEGQCHGTFLPSVWEALPKPDQFMRHLKQKAGLPADYWSDKIKMYRYHTEMIS